MAGALEGLRIVEIASIGPGAFCGMMLADQGADVIRIERPFSVRPGLFGDSPANVHLRSRRSIAIDLKSAAGAQIARDLAARADGLIEGFRPGVMERLGLGPEELLAANAKLVYGRATGWGQRGRLAQAAGHDINYIALSGVLHACGRAGHPPTPPLNLIDFGGGGMMLAFGMLAGVLRVHAGGRGQVIDCAMVDGAATLMGLIYGLRTAGLWRAARGTNVLDTGAHFYEVYETSDGKYVSIGAIEPAFYAELRRLIGCDADADFDQQSDYARWAQLKETLARVFRTRTRDEWCKLLEGTDACFAPVLSMDEAPSHPHNRERGTFIEVAGATQPAPAPRFSDTPAPCPRPPAAVGADSREVLRELGYPSEKIEQLFKSRVVADGAARPRTDPQ